MADLSRTPSQFFISVLFIFILTMTMYSFFRSLGALCGSLDIGDYLGVRHLVTLLIFVQRLVLLALHFKHSLCTQVRILESYVKHF